ncbi:Matrix metalloproteinase, putative [Ricinus communis]|uniref:Matrix metalloproteinase, putative n=1 Tax=Ricinus communis TaxID=3988 RepID=B9RUG7_RICCO|nr:Matrix metalloproteinase, putative [Ricinus communis]|eukprot:XP_002517412.1 metalloendoproteinase 3-MMP [Ricinus communis]
MASKPFLPILLSTLIAFTSLVSHAAAVADTKSLPFEFLKHLQGCHKGDKLKGVGELKKYLKHFGYLSYNKNQSHANEDDDDDFDDPLESAIRTYQLNYHLNVSGLLDSETASKMMMPRCGVADIINGTTWMESGRKHHRHPHRHHHRRHGPKSLHKVSHYSFFSGNPKWPPSKYHLTYSFLPGFPTAAVNPVANAFETWAANTHFSFSWTRDYINSDILISFYRGDHGDGHPFDGPGGTLAHAFAPQNGLFHYDADERWSIGAVLGAYDLETTALHEIGHLLGLGHSSVEGAIMYPQIFAGETRGLHSDDLEGIRTLYNIV